jgi:ABC-type antimicrobial peptide transport system permease subunit
VRLETLTTRLQSAFSGYRELVWLGTALGLLSLTLAATGLFALMSYTVRRRTREIGVRLAVGASPRVVAAMVLRQGFTLVGAGVAAGFAVSVPTGLVIRSALVGVSPVDPVAACGVIGLFIGVALVALILPALRAARVDPVIALRQE